MNVTLLVTGSVLVIRIAGCFAWVCGGNHARVNRRGERWVLIRTRRRFERQQLLSLHAVVVTATVEAQPSTHELLIGLSCSLLLPPRPAISLVDRVYGFGDKLQRAVVLLPRVGN